MVGIEVGVALGVAVGLECVGVIVEVITLLALEVMFRCISQHEAQVRGKVIHSGSSFVTFLATRTYAGAELTSVAHTAMTVSTEIV